jgi:hypothetical protein
MILFEVISSREREGSEREQIRRRGLYHIETRELETKDKESDRLHDLTERSVCPTSQQDEQRTQRTIDHGRLRRFARVYPLLFCARAQSERIPSADHRGSLGGCFSRCGLFHSISLRWIVIEDRRRGRAAFERHVDVGEYWT